MTVRDTVPLDVHPTHRRGVEKHIDEMVVEEVHLVDVQHTTVRSRQQPRGERVLAVAQYLLQVQRSDDAVLGGTDRQLHQLPAVTTGRRGEHLGETAHGRRLGGALLAADQHSPDVRSDRAQHQRQA